MANLLIVDENPGDRSLLANMLGDCGYTILEASDGGEALARVRAERPDLVITNIAMPKMDGYEFVRRLRSIPEIAQTPVIFWTAAFREPEVRDTARGCGVEYILSKPCTDDTARQTVETCVHRIYENRRLYAHATAQKMEALGRLAGGMAHDFNNALNVIIGYSKMLMAKGPEDAAYTRVAEIHKAGERAAALTQELLAFSGKQMLQPRLINLADVLRELEPALTDTLGKGIELVKHIGRQLCPVTVDPIYLRQAVLNLASNAQEAMPDGGVLTVTLADVALDDSAGQLYEIPAGRYAMLTLADTGRGMTQQIKQRALEPFFTTKPTGQGVGLGLASAYGIIKQSGGNISLESEPGCGTTCKLFLPLHFDESESSVTRGAQRIPRRIQTILVVEDDPAIRLLVEEILAGAGYNVLVAGSGNKAIEIADQHEGAIHLLLTDVLLPHMGGKEIASRITLVRPETKVLFMSGYIGNVAGERQHLEPGAEFLQKPFTPDALCEAVRGLLAASSRIRRVLVVDDDPSLRNLLAVTLEEAGLQAFTAEDGCDARMQVEQHGIDLVMTDLAMPGEEGMELIRALKKEHPALKIVAMSGAFGTDVLRAARALGAHISLVKPISKETILQSIDQLSRD